jgi:CRP/FNR family transcriptional regulator, cyclic AMP receptor protein
MPPELLEKHARLLHAIPLFAGLSPEQLTKVAALAQARSYPGRTAVVTQGEPASALFGIVHGRLKVSSAGPDGRDTVLGIMAEGEIFGEVALLDGGPRSATCTTMEPCELLVIARQPFLELVESSPSIGVKLLEVLARRLRRLSQRSENSAFLEVSARLARIVLDLAVRFGERRQKPVSGIYVTLKLSQQELGDLIGATRESVNKQLSDWTRQGIVTLQAGRIAITDPDALRALACLDDD